MNGNTPQPPAAPPTPQGELDIEPPQSKWPVVFGILSLLYTCGGLFCHFGLMVWVGLGNSIPEMWRGGMEMSAIIRITSAVSRMLALILGVMLLIGAVGLLRRRRSAPSLLRKWVVLRLCLAVVDVLTAFVTMPAQIEMARSQERYMERMVRENPGNTWMQTGPPKTDDQLWNQIALQLGIYTLVVSVFPLTLGLWLSRKRIVGEVSTWE